MDNKYIIDNSDKTETIKSETINSDHLATVDRKKVESPTVDQENKESITGLQLHKPTSVSGQLLSTSDMESAVYTQDNLIEPTQDQIVRVSQDSLIKESQQVIIVTDPTLNNDLKLEDNGVVLDQQSMLSRKYLEMKGLVKRELSEFSPEEPSQNVGPHLLEIKSEFMGSEVQIKFENLENSLCKVDNVDQKEEEKSENYTDDALSTLAYVALNQAPPTKGTAKNVISKSVQPIVQVKHEEPAWCDIGVIKDTTCLVKQFHSTSITDEHENISLDNLPDYRHKLKIDIQPGTFYKLRIAAINTCGRGEWSETSVFKTRLPGYPDGLSDIKIRKGPSGTKLTWKALPNSSGEILEYVVCVAIKNSKDVPHQSSKPTSTNLNFVRVYSGTDNSTVVSNESLGAALIDRTRKPAMIFRIVAKNEKGYGPATQVRWLQDNNVPRSNENTSMKRKESVNLLTEIPKRPKM